MPTLGPLLEASQFCFSSYVPGLLQAAAPSLDYRASQSDWASLFMRPARGRRGTPVDLCLAQMQSMLVFTASYYRDFSSWHWCPRLRTWVWNWDPMCSSRNLYRHKIVNCHIMSLSLLLVFLCGFFFISFVMVMGLLFSWSSGVTDGCLVILV